MRLSTGFFLATAFAAVSIIAVAQVTTATFYGIVTDSTGAAIPSATVTLIHEGTGATATRTTSAIGEFGFDFVAHLEHRAEP